MKMKKETAKKLIEIVNSHDHQLEQVVEALIAENADPAERKRFARAVGSVMADGLEGVLAPIFYEHKDLAPEWWT
jgi:hypothetical protein